MFLEWLPGMFGSRMSFPNQTKFSLSNLTQSDNFFRLEDLPIDPLSLFTLFVSFVSFVVDSPLRVFRG